MFAVHACLIRKTANIYTLEIYMLYIHAVFAAIIINYYSTVRVNFSRHLKFCGMASKSIIFVG